MIMDILRDFIEIDKEYLRKMHGRTHKKTTPIIEKILDSKGAKRNGLVLLRGNRGKY